MSDGETPVEVGYPMEVSTTDGDKSSCCADVEGRSTASKDEAPKSVQTMINELTVVSEKLAAMDEGSY